MNRRDLLASVGTLAACAGLPTIARAAPDQPREIRIGYQKSSILAIVKQRGLLEARFDQHAVAVRWREFPYGPPLLEALGAGSLDYGYTGNAPPIFAQAARAPILYVAVIPARGGSNGIVVPSASPIKTLGDLAGKTVGVARGSSAHDLLVSALDSVHIPYDGIKPVYLAPADAASAFARGAIDAWSIWDPFLAIAEMRHGARQLAIDPEAAQQDAFFLASRSFTERYPDAVAAINADVTAAAAYAGTHREEAAALYAAATGVDLASETRTVGRSDFVVGPITAETVTRQQAVADRFARIYLIPGPVKVADIVWTHAPGG